MIQCLRVFKASCKEKKAVMKSEVAFVLLFYGATVLAHHCHVGKGDQSKLTVREFIL